MIVKNVEKKENNTAVFQVESDAAEFEAAVNGAYLKNKASIYIPGFRKGKAPRAVVEGMYGKDVFYQDAMDELAPQAFEQGVKEAELRFVGAPSITDVNVTDERTAAYTFTVTLYPEVTLGQYKGIEATREPVSVSDEDVNAEVESARKRNARKVSVEREAQMGDTADIDFEGTLDGVPFDGGKAEGYELELGSNTFVPGFEEQIVGMNIGDEKDINITFPEDYAAELAGKDVVFKVKLNGLRPTLDSLKDALHLEAAEKEIEELEGQSARDGFWNDVENSQRVQKRLKQLKGKTENYQKLCAQWDDLMTLCEMAIEENDDSMLPELQSDFAAFDKKLEETRLGTLLTGEYDANNAILTFHAGAGGT